MDPSLLIFDVKEKEPAPPKAPAFPQARSTATGFPEHKKRPRVSAFKKQRQGPSAEDSKPQVFTTSSREPLIAESREKSAPSTQGQESESFNAKEQRRIDRENNDRLASMSPQEIEEARQELFGSLDSKTLEMLLKRSTLEDSQGPSPFDAITNQEPVPAPPEIRIEDTSRPSKPDSPEASIRESKTLPRPTVEDDVPEDESPEATTQPAHRVDDSAPSEPPADQIVDATDESAVKPHWPRHPQPSDIDPADPNFLQNLHEKYFPSLPADPAKLSWMAPVPTPNSPADLDSPYHPNQSSLPAASLRFDFRGMLLPPRIARAVPMSKGLHHHGEAPESAGYTVAELARLSRSSVPGQRCMAYQTLGRVLFRLGRCEFGDPADRTTAGSEVAIGIWRQVEEGAVLRSLYDEAATEEGKGHRSARAFAIEALWLLEKGGWKERLRKAMK